MMGKAWWAVIVFLVGNVVCSSSRAGEDPYLWLEEIDGERALEWVGAQNEATAKRLKSSPEFESLYREALAALDSSSRIPSVSVRAGMLYNIWRDTDHPRGVYRRTTLEEFRKPAPQWETVLDIDALSAAEGTQWVFKGMSCLPPAHRRCLVRLSPGGGDAVEIREFDAKALGFVEGGFFLPTAKTQTSWIDESTIYVGTDFGPGSMTSSGYPRIAKTWKRGTPLDTAVPIFEGGDASYRAGAYRLRTNDGDIDLAYDSLTFWTSRRSQIIDGELHELDLPDSAVIEDGYLGRLVISLKDDWERAGTSYGEGWVLIADPAALRGGEGTVEVLVEPGEGEVVEHVNVTKDGILVTMLDNVRGRLDRYEPTEDGGWTRRTVSFPDNGALSVTSIDDDTGDFFVEYESFVTPPTLYFVSASSPKPLEVKAQVATFDGSRFEVDQLWATSADGTNVPYFIVMRKGLVRNGKNPTHVFSYGGFRNSLTPSYSGSYEALYGAYGTMWLERGGVFVLANIRGGGEFGPAWWSAALKENRHRAFEDFEAVAEDLVARKITSAAHLGIEGRSNGGLLVAAAFTRRPDLYGAVICGVPLADMRRYHELLAGASWMAEYGDPDVPEEWAYLSTYSPYQNLKKDQPYPAVFFYGSTRDDRVHPGHGRKMAAKMQELGYEVWFYENTEGGHGGSSTNEQLAYRLAQAYTHLWNQLK